MEYALKLIVCTSSFSILISGTVDTSDFYALIDRAVTCPACRNDRSSLNVRARRARITSICLPLVSSSSFHLCLVFDFCFQYFLSSWDKYTSFEPLQKASSEMALTSDNYFISTISEPHLGTFEEKDMTP